MALRGTLTHWKTRILANELGIPACFALGVLESLWHTTAELAPAGNIGRLSNKAIAMEMFWEKDPEILIAALIASGHLDRDDDHRLTVHDWVQHSDYNTKRKVERRGEKMVGNGKLNTPIVNHDESQPVMTRHKSIPEPEPEPVKKQTHVFSTSEKGSFPLPKFTSNAIDKMRELYGRTVKPLNEECWMQASMEIVKQEIPDETIWRVVIPLLESKVEEWNDKSTEESFIPSPASWLHKKPWTLKAAKQSRNGNEPHPAMIMGNESYGRGE